MLTSRVRNGFREMLQRTVRPVTIRLAALLMRLLSHDDLRALIKQARADGALNESDSAMLSGIFAFHHKKIQDVMRPRTEVVALPLDATERQVRDVLRAERYSRYPVYRGSLDDIAGVFVAKDLWLAPSDTGAPFTGAPFALQQFVREALYVPRKRPAERVLDDLRRTRAHMAIVLDEYGGTAGIVTVEDLVEQVIGEIADEYDLATRRAMNLDGVLELAGSLSLIDVRAEYEVPIPEGEWTTLGGYTFAGLGRAPHIGDRVPFPSGELEIIAVDGRRIAALRVHRDPAPDPAARRAARDISVAV
jgi:CBS domain containing-hemolysin-like protein